MMQNKIRHARTMKKIFTPSLIALVMGLAVLLPTESEAKCGTKCALRKVTKSTKSAANKITKFASENGRKLSSFTSDEVNSLSNATINTLTDFAPAITSSYSTAVSGITSLDGLIIGNLETQLKKRARQFNKANSTTIARIGNGIENLSDQGRAAVKRIVTALPNKSATDAVMADMRLLAKELKFGELKGKANNSSWGISLNTSAALIAGAGGGIGIVLNSLPEPDGSLKGAIIAMGGGSIGLSGGIAGSVGMFWQPDVAKESTGLSLGFSASGGVDGFGGGLENSFGISTDAKDYANVKSWAQGVVGNLIPSVGFSVDLPGLTPTEVEVSVDMNVGWTQVLTNFTIPPNICEFSSEVANGITTTKLVPGSYCPGTSADSKT